MKTLAVLSLSLALCLLPACDNTSTSRLAKSTLAKIVETQTLKVGYIVFPPIITKDLNTGTLGGHFVATIEEITRQAGWKVEYVETDWSSFSGGLNAHRFDVSIAPTFTTIPRSLAVSFTRPLLFAGNSAIAHKDDNRFSDILSIDRPGIKVAVIQGEAGHEFAKENFQHAKLIVHPGPDQMLAFQDVLANRVDVALGDVYVTAKFAELHSEVVQDLFGDNPYNLTPVSWAVRYGDTSLLAFLNAAIETLDIQGKLAEYEEQAGAHWIHQQRLWKTN